MNTDNYASRIMIEAAMQAPSSHNSQPWVFHREKNKIEIAPDFSKSLPIVDVNNRELFISLGCAVENLCIAASTLRYQSEIIISKEGTIIIPLISSNAVQPDPLFSQIKIRQTNRQVYDYRNIADNKIADHIQTVSLLCEGIQIYCWKKNSTPFELLKQSVVKGNTIQMENKKFVRELKSWMRYNKKHSESERDGLSYEVFGAPNLPAFISKPVMASYLNSKKQNKGDLERIDSSSHFILFTTQEDSINQWIHLGRILQRFLLITTKAGIAHAYMNQPCEVEELRNELRNELSINNEIPQLLLRIGYASPAPYSKRKEYAG